MTDSTPRPSTLHPPFATGLSQPGRNARSPGIARVVLCALLIAAMPVEATSADVNPAPHTTTRISPASPGLACVTLSCASTAANICPASPFPFANTTSGAQPTPTFAVNSTASFVISCGGVSATWLP